MAQSPRPPFPALIFLSTACLFISACDSPKTDAQASAPALTVLVKAAEQRDVTLSMDMVGTTRGNQDVPIRARVDGFIETMTFNEGTFVKKGDPLYTIDPQPFKAKLVEAQSQLAASQTQLTRAISDLERIRPLADMNAVSKQDLDSAVAEADAARASVQASKANVELAEIELGYTEIMAPIDGLIGLTQAKPGEYVGREPNPVVLNVLSDIDPIRVRFSISEREYLIMARTYMADNKDDRRDGQPPEERPRDLELYLADGSLHKHKGAGIAASQAIDPTTGTFSIEALFPNPNALLLPGQFARVRAKYEVLEDVVVIPRRAVSEMQGLFRAYVVGPDGTVQVREITLGPDAGQDVVVEAGINAGESVVIDGIQKVRPGMPVNSQPWSAPTDSSAGAPANSGA